MDNNLFVAKYNLRKEITEEDYLIIIKEGKVLINKKTRDIPIPQYKDIIENRTDLEVVNFMGYYKNRAIFIVELKEKISFSNEFEYISIKEFGLLVDEKLFQVVGRANQIFSWEKSNKFCGSCGSPMINKDDERAKICSHCNNVVYPTICPAIIVAIKKDNKILLAHNRNFKDDMYSIIAGFVDPGENLEEAVKREVYEEIGIKVKNIKYHSSQPWSFPYSLMIGFTADYNSGEIRVDGKEILHADWYDKYNLPKLPEKISIARKIIDGYLEGDF